MRPRLLTPLLCLLAACASPNPLSGYTQRAEARSGDYKFAVFWSASDYEVVRTNFGRPRDRAAFTTAILDAVGRTTGCTPTSPLIEPDRTIARGELTC